MVASSWAGSTAFVDEGLAMEELVVRVPVELLDKVR